MLARLEAQLEKIDYESAQINHGCLVVEAFIWIEAQSYREDETSQLACQKRRHLAQPNLRIQQASTCPILTTDHNATTLEKSHVSSLQRPAPLPQRITQD